MTATAEITEPRSRAAQSARSILAFTAILLSLWACFSVGMTVSGPGDSDLWRLVEQSHKEALADRQTLGSPTPVEFEEMGHAAVARRAEVASSARKALEGAESAYGPDFRQLTECRGTVAASHWYAKVYRQISGPCDGQFMPRVDYWPQINEEENMKVLATLDQHVSDAVRDAKAAYGLARTPDEQHEVEDAYHSAIQDVLTPGQSEGAAQKMATVRRALEARHTPVPR